MTTTAIARHAGVTGGGPGETAAGSAIDMTAAVAEFHKAFGLPTRQVPSADVGDALARLRVALLEEEVGEFVAASQRSDLVGIADALADIVYVAYGTALTYGIDLNTILCEVHRSNMSKLGRDGKPIFRDDGKVIKSELYFPPDIAAVLSQQAQPARQRDDQHPYPDHAGPGDRADRGHPGRGGSLQQLGAAVRWHGLGVGREQRRRAR